MAHSSFSLTHKSSKTQQGIPTRTNPAKNCIVIQVGEAADEERRVTKKKPRLPKEGLNFLKNCNWVFVSSASFGGEGLLLSISLRSEEKWSSILLRKKETNH